MCICWIFSDAHETDYSPRLNTFLELKMENERLHQRLSKLRKQAPQLPPLASSSTMPASYGPALMPASLPYPAPVTISNRDPGEMAQPYYSTPATTTGGYNSMMHSSFNSIFCSSDITPHTAMYTLNSVMDEDISEDGFKKKKVKMIPFRLYLSP